MKFPYIALLWCFSLFPCSAQTIQSSLYRPADLAKMNAWVDSVFKSMSLDERIGQLFMIVVRPEADSRNMQRLTRYMNEIKPGGLLYYKGNFTQQAKVTNLMQKASRIPLFISLDGEWGLSMRLSGTTRFPKNMMLGAIGDNRLIEEYGKEVGRQCNEMGIHINFSPSVDVNSSPDNPVIGMRSFGENPHAVAEKGIAYAQGLESMQVISVAKHFPGHGDTSEDSHETLPVIRHDMARLDSVELYPFKQYIEKNFAGVMTGHLRIPALDKAHIASSLSKPIVTDFLQKTLGFNGLCITDALVMKGAAVSKAENVSVKALLAGNDIILAPESPIQDFQAVKEAISKGTLKQEEVESKCLKILKYKYLTGLNRYNQINTKGLDARLNSPHAAWLAAKLNSEAITVLKNTATLPLKGLDKVRIASLSIGGEEGNEFQTMLNRYDTVACFSIKRTSSTAHIRQVYDRLKDYDVIICGIHTVRIPESESLRNLSSTKKLILSFFTTPYFCREYSRSIQKAQGIVMAYEATPLAQGYAAQVIFGGIGAKGKLPVSIPGLYKIGTGLITEKIRLGYHEPEEVRLNKEKLGAIDSIVSEGLDKRAFPGCQVLVAKDDMIVYNKSFGYYDYNRTQKVNEKSVYDLASSSKATGTLLAVMKAYDEKKFRLESRISEFIPDLRTSNKKNLTIQDLLYHESGVIPSISFYTSAIDSKSYTGSLYSDHKDRSHPIHFDTRTYVRDDFKYLPSVVSTISKPGFTTEVSKNFFVSDSFKDSIMKQIKDSRLSSHGKFRYSCINFIMLKMMVEKQTGIPMDQFLYTTYFNKLGARYATYTPLKKMDTLQIVPTENDQFVRRQLLRGYVHDEAAAFQGGVSGNAGLFSNANDLAKILQLYLNSGTYGGETYLSERTCRLFTQSKSSNSHRGLGFDKPIVGNPELSSCGELAPPSVYGHTGYTGTCFWIDPDNHLIYIFLSNRVNTTRMNKQIGTLGIRTQIQDAIYKAFDKKSEKD